MADMLEDVRALAEGIGPRPSASAAEERAARYVQEELAKAGVTAEIEEFRGLDSFSWPQGITYLLGAAAVGVFRLLPPGGILLAWLGLILFWLEIDGVSPLSRLLSRRPSRNVLGKIGEGRPAIVLVAHLDSSRAALSFAPSQVGRFRATFLGVMAAFDLPALLLPAALLWPVLYYPALLGGAYLFLTALLLAHREIFHHPVPGANDNASGVAVLLALGRRLGQSPPAKAVWLLGTGCEESGLLGMAAFLRRHRPEVRESLFLNLDNLGKGDLLLTASEGMLRRFATAREIREAFRQAAAETGVKLRVAGFHLMSTDALPVLQTGGKAGSLLALDEKGRLPHWHWYTDTPAAVDEENLRRAEILTGRAVEILLGNQSPA